MEKREEWSHLNKVKVDERLQEVGSRPFEGGPTMATAFFRPPFPLYQGFSSLAEADTVALTGCGVQISGELGLEVSG